MVSDPGGGSDTTVLTIEVSAPPPNNPPAFTAVTSNQEQTVKAGEPFTPLAATDPEDPSVTFKQIGGELPPGVTINAHGTFSGTPTTPGDYTVLVRVCDALMACVDRSVDLHVLSGSVRAPVDPAPAPANPPAPTNPATPAQPSATAAQSLPTAATPTETSANTSVAGPLARAGASAMWMAATGVAFLSFGALLLGGSRRRRRPRPS